MILLSLNNRLFIKNINNNNYLLLFKIILFDITN